MSEQNSSTSPSAWYATWFNTPFYHTLYQNRDQKDAAVFLSGVLDSLQVKPGSKILDLACGKGRHARFLNEKGMNVVGIDLSKQSIESANEHANAQLGFEIADMRSFELDHKFDYIFSLFTSFGYFDDDADNLAMLAQVRKHLLPGGTFLLDYLNPSFVAKTLVPYEEKEIDGITFCLSKSIENGFVVKRIEFSTKNQDFSYQEKVRLFTFADFEQLMATSELKIAKCFGDYSLGDFDQESSERFILTATHA